MQRISYLLLGLSFLASILTCLSFKKAYTALNMLMSFVLTVAIIYARTDQQMLLNILWAAWISIFAGIALAAHYSSKGTVNIYENKFLLWGLYVPYNVLLAAARFLIKT